MATVFGLDYEPRVLQLAESSADDMFYLRVSCKLSTFLLRDTADVFDSDPPLEQDPGPTAFKGLAGERARHRYIQLKHAKLPYSAFFLHPERDVLWLNHATSDENLEELKLYYGQQLRAIQNIMFEESEWDDVNDCLEKLKYFTGVRTIYVWLDSYRFQSGAVVTSQRGYLQKSREFQARDRGLFHGRDLVVEYFDYEKNIYGGFRAND